MSHLRSAQCAFSLSLFYGFLLLIGGGLYLSFACQPQPKQQPQQTKTYGQLPLVFEANHGQTDESIRYLSSGMGYSLSLTNQATACLTFKEQTRSLQIKLQDANPNPISEAQEPVQSYSNYLIGNDPRAWRTRIPHYAKVKYEQVYPGIDLVFYGNRSQLEYDFIVQPHADVQQIKLTFDEAKAIQLDDHGDLLLQLDGAEIRQRQPETYQLLAGVKQSIASRYVLQDNQQVGLAVDAYDHARPLIIDPVLVYSTGSIGGTDMAVDANGNAYLLGVPRELPLANSLPGQTSDSLVSLARLNATGTALDFVTRFGGNGWALASSIELDEEGNIYVAGSTTSTDFPKAINQNSGGGSVLKSLDGGATWRDVNVDNGSPTREMDLIGATVQGLYAKLPTPTGAAQRFARSLNGGESWSPFAFPNLPDADFSLKGPFLDPSIPSTLYVSLKGLFKSTNGGDTWTNITNGLTVNPELGARLAVAPSAPNVVYVTLARESLRMARSTNGGSSWQTFSLPVLSRNTVLVVDPKNADTVYLDTDQGLYKTINGGAQWTSVSAGLPLISNQYHYAVDDLLIDPKTSATLYACGSFGVYKSINGGGNWTNANTGIPNYSFPNHLAIDAQQTSIIYAYNNNTPAGVNVFRSRDAGNTWQKVVIPGSTSLNLRLITDPQLSGVLYFNYPYAASSDAFVAKLNSTGTAIIFSRYLGGGGSDDIRDLAVGKDKNIYVTGWTTYQANITSSPKFPVTDNAYLNTLINPVPDLEGIPTRYNEIFVTKITPTGSLAYSTYLGSNGENTVAKIAVDEAGNFYVAGTTLAPNFLGKPADVSQRNDVFLAKFAPARTGKDSLLYSRFFSTQTAGKNVPGQAAGLKVDALGNAYLLGTGVTATTPGAFQTGLGSGFVAKVNPPGSALHYLTMLGTVASYLTYPPATEGFLELPTDLALDANGNAYIVGYTNQDLPTTPDAVQPKRAPGDKCSTSRYESTRQCNDAFLLRLNPAGNALTYATYFGGSGDDGANRVAVNNTGNAYVTGWYSKSTFSSGFINFPITAGAFTLDGKPYGFTAKFAIGTNPITINTSLAHVSAASFERATLLPESIVAVFGNDLATGTQAASTIPLPTSLAGTSVKVGDYLAPLFFVSPTQINYLVPIEFKSIFSYSVPVVITNSEGKAALSSMPRNGFSGGLFAANGNGQGVAAGVILRVKANGQQQYETIAQFDTTLRRFVPIPIDLGPESDQVFLVLFGTGLRSDVITLDATVTVGGITTPALYVGKQPSLVGVDQLNLKLPRSLAGRGVINVNLTLFSQTTNTVQVQIK